MDKLSRFDSSVRICHMGGGVVGFGYYAPAQAAHTFGGTQAAEILTPFTGIQHKAGPTVHTFCVCACARTPHTLYRPP
jgi:cytochrome b subunit of formate dehydrogenase